ncbi:hypothetical protein PC120_g19028 [Phytophthora cactorum]|nr:hypothetical protein PC120_g19028 [Phytophthora cactorum]
MSESSSNACSSPAKTPSVPLTGMRSPTKIRTPTKLVRPREIRWASRAKDVKKRLLEARENHLGSALPPSKRVTLSTGQSSKQSETRASSSEVPGAGEELQEAEEKETCAGYADGLHRQVQVAQCLEEDLLRDNARMRLKVLNLRDEVEFYYGLLARIELVAADKIRESTGNSNEEQEQITKLTEQLQRIISASKSVEEVATEMASLTHVNKSVEYRLELWVFVDESEVFWGSWDQHVVYNEQRATILAGEYGWR